MSIFVFFLCFLVAVLSGLGVGGGSLLAVILSLFSEIPTLTVQGINLYFFLFSGAASLLVHLARRKISGGTVLICTLFGTVGTFLGSALAHALGGSITRKLFGALLIYAGLSTLWRALKHARKHGQPSPKP